MSVSLTEEQLEFLGREGRKPAQQLSRDLDLLRRLIEESSKSGNRQLARLLEKAQVELDAADQ